MVTAPTRRSKAPSLRNAGTAPGACRGEAATGRRRQARAARLSSACPAARLAVGGLQVGTFCFTRVPASVGKMEVELCSGTLEMPLTP